MKMNWMALPMVALLGALSAPYAAAKNVTVQVRNSAEGRAMVFYPEYVRVELGDTVTFKIVDKGHDVVSIPGMVPDGAKPILGKMNQDVVVIFSKPGLYGIKCTPHYSMGMVGLVKVGAPTPNRAAFQGALAKIPSLAQKRLSPLIARAK